MDGSFTFPRWRHLANVIKLVLPSAHPSPQPKRQINRFSCFCTAHGRKSLYFTMGNRFSKIAPSNRGTLTPPNSWFPVPFWAQSLKASRLVQLFSHRWQHQGFYTLQWASLSPKLPLLMGDLDPHLTQDSLGPSKPTTQTASRSVEPFLHRWP